MNIIYFDLETQKLFHEVGGRDPGKLLLACGVTYSTAKNDFSVYMERDAQALIDELNSADMVIGFNILKFDYEVLRPYSPSFNFASLRTFDLLLDLQRTLAFAFRSTRWRGLLLARPKPRTAFSLWNGFVMAR